MRRCLARLERLLLPVFSFHCAPAESSSGWSRWRCIPALLSSVHFSLCLCGIPFFVRPEELKGPFPGAYIAPLSTLAYRLLIYLALKTCEGCCARPALPLLTCA